MTPRTRLTVLATCLFLTSHSAFAGTGCCTRSRTRWTCCPEKRCSCEHATPDARATRQMWVIEFIEADGQSAGTSISDDPQALERQCNNWMELHPGASCRGPFPIDQRATGPTAVIITRDGNVASQNKTSEARGRERKRVVSRAEVKNGIPFKAFPKISITSSSIRIIRLEAISGKVDGISLNGSGGSYSWGAIGNYSIQPGTYDFIVFGSLKNNGWLEAEIEFD